jgi:hypothetical protein
MEAAQNTAILCNLILPLHYVTNFQLYTRSNAFA